jgi:hypothetical protein
MSSLSILSRLLLYREFRTSVDRFMALRFTTTGAPLAARRIRILPMNQHAYRPITFGMKGSSYIGSQITRGVDNADALHVDIPVTGERGSAGILAISLRIFAFSSSFVRGLLL